MWFCEPFNQTPALAGLPEHFRLILPAKWRSTLLGKPQGEIKAMSTFRRFAFLMSLFTGVCENVAQAAVAVDPILDLGAMGHYINLQLEAPRIPELAGIFDSPRKVSMCAQTYRRV